MKVNQTGGGNYEEAMRLWDGIKTSEDLANAKKTGVGSKIFSLLSSAEKEGNLEAIGALALYYAHSGFVNENLFEAKKYLLQLQELPGGIDICTMVINQIQTRVDSVNVDTFNNFIYANSPELYHLLNNNPEDNRLEILVKMSRIFPKASHLENAKIHELLQSLFQKYQYIFKIEGMKPKDHLFFCKMMYASNHTFSYTEMFNSLGVDTNQANSLLQQTLESDVPGAKALSIWLKIKNKISNDDDLVGLLIQLEDLKKNGDISASEYMEELRR